MKTLEQIRDQRAQDSAFDDWGDLCFSHGLMTSIHRFDELTKYVDEVAKLYAQQACEDLRERIAENAMTEFDCMCSSSYHCSCVHTVDKDSILNTEIILP